MINGVEEVMTIKDIEAFLNSDDDVAPPATDDGNGTTPPAPQPGEDDKSKTIETKTFAQRLKKMTDKAVNEERQSIAKSMGYESYEAMLKEKEKDILKDKGLDPDEVSPIVDEIVKKRLEDDPRLKELETLRQQKIQEWGKKELATITELTGGKIKKLEDIPQPVIELWKVRGSLKTAYLELEGENLIKQIQLGGQKGSNEHLNNPQGNPPATNETKRIMTPEEKRVYKIFNPTITDEELNKKMIDK